MRHPAIVTGGASGIGLAAVKRLLDDGWTVAVIDADADALGAAESAFADETAIFLEADITDEDDLAAAFDEVVDRQGLIGGLVNSAGIQRDVPAEDTSAELFREILEVNLVGSLIAAKAALERMGATLSIVNVVSVSGLRANRGRGRLWRLQGRNDVDDRQRCSHAFESRLCGDERADEVDLEDLAGLLRTGVLGRQSGQRAEFTSPPISPCRRPPRRRRRPGRPRR